jgi:polysaccharide chain length determinant protein (PEP-CTERM system associated)
MPLVQALWRHRWLAVGTAWLVCTAGWIGANFLPTKFESSARVYLNTDPLLTPLLRGLAADTDPGRNLDFMQRTLLSRPNMEQLIRLTDLDIGIRTPGEKEAVLKGLASEISVIPITSNLLTLSYRNTDPVLAKNIVQSLLTIFADKMAGSSRADMDSAQRFLDDEIASYRDQLRAAEKRRSELAEKYPDIVENRSPDAPGGNSNVNRLEQARQTIIQLKLELADAASKQNAIQKELDSVPSTLTIDHGGPQVIVTGGRMSPIEERLLELRRNLDGLRLKYTEQHPDVKAARQEIAQLQSEVGKSSGGGAGQAGNAANKGQIVNDAYTQIKVKLVDAEAVVAAVQRHVAEAETQEAKIEKTVQSAPGVLAQVQDLDRDYGVLKRNYMELVARREATQIANAADTKTEKIQFRIVDAPQVPTVPIAPNRPLLVTAVLVLGIGSGLAVPLLMMQLDHSFATVGQLRNLGVPILGSVSRVSLGPSRRRAALQMVGVAASALVLVAVYGTLLLLSTGRHSISVSQTVEALHAALVAERSVTSRPNPVARRGHGRATGAGHREIEARAPRATGHYTILSSC